MFRKQIVAPIFVTLIILGLVLDGCSPTPPQEPGRILHRSKGFSIKFPNGWDKMKDEEGVIAAKDVLSDTEAEKFGARVVVVVRKMRKGFDFVKEYQQYLDSTPNTYVDFELQEDKKVTVGGVETRCLLFSETKGNMRLQNLQYMFPKEDNLYCITCSSTEHRFPYYKSEFEEIVQSFRFE